MEKVGFIGAFDKTDLILNLAKILTTIGKKVIVIDSTITQKAKYVVPVINPTASYITNFEDIDVAVGFNSIEEIKKYLGTTQEDFTYDIALIDIDNLQGLKEFEISKADKKFFVTSFDLYSLKKGLEILSELKEPITLTKVLYAKEALKEDDDYLNFLSLDYKLNWEKDIIYFQIENGDLLALYENQRVAKIKFKKLSLQYKESLVYMILGIVNTSESNVRRAIKTIERGV